MSEKVVTRFAPSPTGFIHVGNVRTALYAWLLARKNNGQFILRIEDTDQKREVAGSLEHIKKSLKWLGLDWDQGPDVGGPYEPYIQSERLKQLDIYKKYAEKLIESGYAYADTSEEEKLEELRKKAEVDKRPFLYREYRPENPPEWKAGIPLRFKIKELKRTIWQDAVRGELSAGPEALDDFILIKSDGYPTYNFAHIVDDIEMGVTHVVRGQEFISSTPNYIAVYEALGAKEPVYVTTPPIMGKEGKKKLGKRDSAKDILDYEREGYLPETMINYLAFLGFNPGGEKEIYSREELISVFDLNKVQSSGAKWDDEKLDWMNKEHMKLLSSEEIEKNIFERLPENMRNKELVPLIFERISKWGDVKNVLEEFSYLFGNLKDLNQNLIWKKLDNDIEKFEKTSEYLQKVFNLLEVVDVNEWTYESLRNAVWNYAESIGKGNVLWPMRFALSRVEKSPDPIKLAELLGKSLSLERIESAIKFLRGITKITIYTKDFFKDLPIDLIHSTHAINNSSTPNSLFTNKN